MIASGLKTSYAAVKKYIAEMKDNNKICIRFHTKDGEEAQVDFGYVGLGFYKQSKLESQFVTSIKGGKVKLPLAFTEKGVYMLSTILKSSKK